MSHDPEYRVSEVPAGTPVFPDPGHAPDEIVEGGGVGALGDVLDELDVVDDVDEVVRVLVEEELAGAELAELEDVVDDDDVLVRPCHHVGLGFRHHPPP